MGRNIKHCVEIFNKKMGDFPGGPVVKTLLSNAVGVGLITGQGATIPHASWPKIQNIKQKLDCNKFNKDLKKKIMDSWSSFIYLNSCTNDLLLN